LAFTAAEHVGKARENEGFARSLDATILCSLEWAVTVNFYAALHYVQAYFAAQKISFKQHTNRATAIARDARLKTVYQDYREMQDASEAARYEVNGIKLDDLAHAEACLVRVKTAIQEADPTVVG
jgi:pantothenate synthetase